MKCILVLPPLLSDGVTYVQVGEELDLPEPVARQLMSQGIVCVVDEKGNPVELPEPSPPAIAQELPPADKTNLNTATKEVLAELKFVGKATAQRIIEGRPYDSLDAAQKVSRLPDDSWNEIKDSLTV